MTFNYPKSIFSGYHGPNHCQGIAVDKKGGFIYYSFTTLLVKSDLDGNIVGTCGGLIGHLGCIDFCEDDGKVYGSLEFKNDSIGKGIKQKIGVTRDFDDAFYCAVFDVDKINRVGMDAKDDGVMRAVYLSQVADDYKAKVNYKGVERAHRYGCSGIDGTGWGVMAGEKSLCIAYGIYLDVASDYSDYQIILSFPDALKWWDTVAKPLDQSKMHRSGENVRGKKYFVYTGNTNWGVQNLEYDEAANQWYLAVYRGKKPDFPNFSGFFVSPDPVKSRHKATGEEIDLLPLAEGGESKNGLSGTYFEYGSTGTYSFGDGYWYFSHRGKDEEKGNYTEVYAYVRADDETGFKEIG